MYFSQEVSVILLSSLHTSSDGSNTFLTRSQLRWHGTSHLQTDCFFTAERLQVECGHLPEASKSSEAPPSENNIPLKRAVTSDWEIC